MPSNIKKVIALLEENFGVPEQRKSSKSLVQGMIGIILSQNTTDGNSSEAYQRLVRRFSSAEQIAHAEMKEIAEAIRIAGLQQARAKTIKALLLWSYKQFGTYELESMSTWSTEKVFDQLTHIPGIGTKTAAVFLLFYLNRDVFPVDTHVNRICRRMGLVPTNASPEKTFRLINPIVPKGKSLSLHVNMIRLGRTICKARKPLCSVCPVEAICAKMLLG